MKKNVYRLKTFLAIVVFWYLLATICGCSRSIWVHYPTRLSRARLYLTEGRDNLAEKELNSRLRSDRDKLLYSMESGMVQYLQGDYDKCIDEWLVAEKMMEKFDRRPVVSVREIGENIGTLAVNDYLMTYQGMTYERVLLHIYLALAYIMKKDPEGARIELKKADQVQKDAFDRWREKRSEQLGGYPEAGNIEKKMLDVYHSRYGMDENFTSFSLNPLAYYLSGWLYEKEGYPDEALIDYKRIWDLGIKTQSIAHTIEDLNRSTEFSYSASRRDIDKKYGTLFIIHQQGLIPALEELRIPMEIRGSFLLMAIPVYPNVSPLKMELRAGTGDTEIETWELVNVYSLARESLKERIPGIAVRELARLILKANASRQMSRKGGTLASMVTTLYNVISEKADLRSWLMIPISIQVGQIRLPQGRHIVKLDLVGSPASTQVEVEIEAGGYHILDVRSIGSRIVTHIN
ncbi:MAG: COG3014 family protein [bacterium]